VGSRQRMSTQVSVNDIYAYIAGFLDADGYITIKLEKSRTCHLGLRGRVRMGFAQSRSRRFVLDVLAKFIGSGVVSEYKHNNMAEYVVNDQDAIFDLLTNIEPFVLVKKKQLDLAKKFILLKKRVGYTKESLELMKQLDKKMSKLNSYPETV
jgi:hypothetical protein